MAILAIVAPFQVKKYKLISIWQKCLFTTMALFGESIGVLQQCSRSKLSHCIGPRNLGTAEIASSAERFWRDCKQAVGVPRSLVPDPSLTHSPYGTQMFFTCVDSRKNSSSSYFDGFFQLVSVPQCVQVRFMFPIESFSTFAARG